MLLALAHPANPANTGNVDEHIATTNGRDFRGGGDRLGEGGTVDRDVPHPVMDRSVGPKTGGHIDDRAVIGKVLHQGLTRLFRVGAVNTRNGELDKVRPMVGPARKRNDGLVMDQTGGESGASGLGRFAETY